MKPAIELAKLAIAYEKAHAVYFPSSAPDMAELASAVCAEEGVRCWISPGGDSITCTKCRLTSRNPNDVTKRYCGNCKVFHDDCPAPRTDARGALELFETMRTDELLELQAAHKADQAQSTTPEGIVFGAGRLALITEVLKKRNT